MIRTLLIAHTSNSACHILETAFPLAYGSSHAADVPDLKQPACHGHNESVTD